jgi:CheY-like chemotaxis protein
VIFLDIGMAKINGYEMARRLREQPWGKQMVLIAVTGWGQAEDKRRSAEAGLRPPRGEARRPSCLGEAAWVLSEKVVSAASDRSGAA